MAAGSKRYSAELKKVASEMTTYLVEAAIANAIDCRTRSGVIDLGALIHHSDAGSQYTAIASG